MKDIINSVAKQPHVVEECDEEKKSIGHGGTQTIQNEEIEGVANESEENDEETDGCAYDRDRSEPELETVDRLHLYPVRQGAVLSVEVHFRHCPGRKNTFEIEFSLRQDARSLPERKFNLHGRCRYVG